MPDGAPVLRSTALTDDGRKGYEGLMRWRGAIDAVMAQAMSAGAVIVKPAQKTFWGDYTGYFQDLDHHLWEVVWNPQLLPEE